MEFLTDQTFWIALDPAMYDLEDSKLKVQVEKGNKVDKTLPPVLSYSLIHERSAIKNVER